MPTGYTSDLYEGKPQTMEQFVLTCARAFGATIMQRDDALSAPLRLPTPSDYHKTALDKAEEELARLLAMNTEEAAEAAANAYEDARRRYEKSMADRVAMRQRYDDMLTQVKGWSPPTTEHDGLKTFMIEQLEESIRFDCGYVPSEPEREDAHEWLRKKIASAKRDIERHTEEWRNEIARTEGRRKWITDLASSLGIEVHDDTVVPA